MLREKERTEESPRERPELKNETGHVVQLVTSLTADPGVIISILAGSHTLEEIDHETISMVILLPSADSRKVVVSYKRKYWLTA